MAWNFNGRTVERILIFDDDPKAREALDWMVHDAELEPVDQAGPFDDIDAVASAIKMDGDAAVCDHHLNIKNYANFEGAALVAQTKRLGIPAILCTRFIESDIDTIRPYLPDIPAVRRPDDLNEPDELREALQECVDEIAGKYREDRRAWRTQVVVVRVDPNDDTLHVELPGWPLDETVRLSKQFLPPEIRHSFVEGFRCHAQVNIGADASQLLYFSRWELSD